MNRLAWWVAATVILTGGVATGESPYAPQPEDGLEQMLTITWSSGPDLPQGFQDSNGGVLGSTFITACGFCSGLNNDKKPGMYPRGFLKKVWAVDLANEAAGWSELPEFPGAARQGLIAVPLGDAIYFWGGFSYSQPYCYTDGYKLSRQGGRWRWEPLPALPWPICGTAGCAIGSTIYVFGGADYDAQAFYTPTDRDGKTERMGARMLCIDTADLHAGRSSASAGWQHLADCPGTPRWVACVTAVGDRIYVIGGATGGTSYNTVVDNWVYDTKRDAWTRLRDLPVASGNFPGGKVVFKDRYIVLGGGYQYSKVANPDGTTREPYGTPRRFEGKGDYYNDVFVYDTQTALFGRATSMPLNNNLSLTVVHGDQVYMIGGETGTAVVEGEFYGHHPELFLKGKIEVAE